MGNREYQIQRTQRDHVEEHNVSSIGPCSLLQEVHDERRDMQIRAMKNDRTCTVTGTSRDQVKIAGAVKIYDSKDEVIIVDHAYNKKIKAADREIVEQYHDRERREHRKDKVLFGLFTGEHKERNITREVLVDGKLSQFKENTKDSKVKFLGITIAHTHEQDNGDERQKEQRRPVQRRMNSKGRYID